MKKNLVTSILYTLITTVILGILYPVLVTGLARFWPEKATGQLMVHNGVVIGSRIIAQPFTRPEYFHPRPSVAGPNGYAADNSSGSNLGPTSKILVDRVRKDVERLRRERSDRLVPVDLVTTSGSGLDPDITPAAAEFQAARVARARGISQDVVLKLVREHTRGRQFGFLGEARVNVVELNLALDTQDLLGDSGKRASSASR